METEHTPHMRHVPMLDELIERLDVRLRNIIDTLYDAAFHSSHEGTPERMKEIEAQFERVILWMDRLCDYARHSRRQPQRDGSLHSRLHHELDSAVAALRSLDSARFGRSASYHSFDKSNAESVYSTVLALGDITWRIGELISTFDPLVFMKVYDRILEVPPIPLVEEGTPVARSV